MTHIYALVSGQLILYVGKTNRTLKQREYGHRRSNNLCGSKYIPEYIDWTIKLLETVTDDQAVTKEQYYYDTLKPLYNCQRPGQTRKDRQNTTKYKEKGKLWKKTDNGKEAVKKYVRLEKTKERVRLWRQSEEGKAYYRNYMNARNLKKRNEKKSEAPVENGI